MMRKIAIFCGGPSSEYEVSLSSAKSILANIDKKKYTPYIFYIKKNLKSAYYKAGKTIVPPTKTTFDDFDKILKDSKDKFDIALLSALHGEFGEDGTIQLFLENLGIKYTGSDSKASNLCMDKFLSMKKVKKIKGISIPKTFKLNTEKINKKAPMNFPFIIKPNALGSSILVSIINNQKDFENAIRKIKQSKVRQILIQELINGIELSCGSLQTKKGKFISLPPIEIRPKSNFFDYSSKYSINGSEEITPPVSIPKKESLKISTLTNTIHKKLNCSVYSRSDFIYKDGEIYYLETNTLPGFTSTSLIPKEALAAGISFSQLLEFIIKESI